MSFETTTATSKTDLIYDLVKFSWWIDSCHCSPSCDIMCQWQHHHCIVFYHNGCYDIWWWWWGLYSVAVYTSKMYKNQYRQHPSNTRMPVSTYPGYYQYQARPTLVNIHTPPPSHLTPATLSKTLRQIWKLILYCCQWHTFLLLLSSYLFRHRPDG